MVPEKKCVRKREMHRHANTRAKSTMRKTKSVGVQLWITSGFCTKAFCMHVLTNVREDAP